MPYSKAVIYKIYNIDEPEKFYVGSTANSIWRRFYNHKAMSKKCKSFFYTEVNRIGWDKFKIEVIENFPCNNKQELFAEEERIRSETKAYYNTLRAYITEEQRANYYSQHKEERYQYRTQHKQEITKYQKKYYKTHKEQILERQKELRKRKSQSF